MANLDCPHCGNPLEVSPSFKDKKFKCKYCKRGVNLISKREKGKWRIELEPLDSNFYF